jgi:hypothetical protein
MLNFRKATKEDFPRLREYFDKFGNMGCECNPANTILWADKYNIKICYHKNYLIKAVFNDDDTVFGYYFPLGEGDFNQIIDDIAEDARQRNSKTSFMMLTSAQCEKLCQITGKEIQFTELYGDEDYIYTNYDLTVLPGKKYHSKRNHISKFNRLFPNWHFDLITPENMKDAVQVLKNWCKNNNIDYEDYEEYHAIMMAFENYKEFKMHGGILYAENVPVAMTMGAQINKKTFDVCFEKALVQYDGSYAKVNNEFAKTLVGFEFINREEDLGIESLRKSKLSYYPAVILQRFMGEI